MPRAHWPESQASEKTLSMPSPSGSHCSPFQFYMEGESPYCMQGRWDVMGALSHSVQKETSEGYWAGRGLSQAPQQRSCVRVRKGPRSHSPPFMLMPAVALGCSHSGGTNSRELGLGAGNRCRLVLQQGASCQCSSSWMSPPPQFRVLSSLYLGRQKSAKNRSHPQVAPSPSYQ